MRFTGIIAALVIAVTMMMAPDASARSEDMKHGMMDKAAMHEKMAAHHEMTSDVLGMFKETLVMLKGLNHTPTAEQKKRLDEMITRMDEIIKKHEERMNKSCDWMQKKMDMKMDRMMNNPCGATAE